MFIIIFVIAIVISLLGSLQMENEPEDDPGYLDEFRCLLSAPQSFTLLQRCCKTNKKTYTGPNISISCSNTSSGSHNLCNKVQSHRLSRSHTISSQPVSAFSLNKYICPNILNNCHIPLQAGASRVGGEGFIIFTHNLPKHCTSSPFQPDSVPYLDIPELLGWNRNTHHFQCHTSKVTCFSPDSKLPLKQNLP